MTWLYLALIIHNHTGLPYGNTQDNPHEEEMADLIYYSVCKMLPYKTYVNAYELYPKHTLLPRDPPLLGTHSVVNILVSRPQDEQVMPTSHSVHLGFLVLRFILVN